MESVNIKINADGSLEYTVKGVKGKSCKDLTKLIDKIATVTESKNTVEYCELPNVAQQKLGGR